MVIYIGTFLDQLSGFLQISVPSSCPKVLIKHSWMFWPLRRGNFGIRFFRRSLPKGKCLILLLHRNFDPSDTLLQFNVPCSWLIWLLSWFLFLVFSCWDGCFWNWYCLRNIARRDGSFQWDLPAFSRYLWVYCSWLYSRFWIYLTEGFFFCGQLSHLTEKWMNKKKSSRLFAWKLDLYILIAFLVYILPFSQIYLYFKSRGNS